MESSLINTMHEYQRKNNIKGECISNSQYLYDSLNVSFPWIDAKVMAVIAYKEKYIELGIINDKMNVCIEHYCCVHMIVEINNNEVLDPSVEIADQDNIIYVGFDICKLLKRLQLEGMTKDKIKFLLEKYLLFKSYAEQINSGKLLFVDKQYYHAQHDYIKFKLSKYGYSN
jgi:hypothetical protein